MNMFLTTAEIKFNDLGNVVTLKEPLEYDYLGERISVPTEYSSDMTTSPRILWWLIPNSQYPYAAILHDWLYTSHMFTRAKSDLIYRQALLDSGASKTYADACYYGVRLVGWSKW